MKPRPPAGTKTETPAGTKMTRTGAEMRTMTRPAEMATRQKRLAKKFQIPQLS